MSYAFLRRRFVPNDIGVAEGDADCVDDALEVRQTKSRENGSARSLSECLQIVRPTAFFHGLLTGYAVALTLR
jgi:hypothetical protein